MNTNKSENSREVELNEQDIQLGTTEEMRSADRSISGSSQDTTQSADRGMQVSDEKEEECVTVKLQKAIDKNIAESAQVHFRALRESGEAWQSQQMQVLELQVGRRSDRLQEMMAMTDQFDQQLQDNQVHATSIRYLQLKIKAQLIQRQQDTAELLLRDCCKTSDNHDEELEWALRFAHTETLLKMGADRIEMAMASLQNIRNMTETDAFKALHEDIREKRLQSVSSLIHSAIRSQVKADRLATAVTIVSEQAAIVTPSTYIVNLLLEGCVRTGEWNTAEKIMQQHATVERDVQTYSSLIKCQSKAGEIHMALQTLDKMQSQGITPDEVLFNSLLDGCSKTGRADLLMKVYRDMRKLDISPSSVTQNSLIDGLVRVGKVEEAWNLFDEMRSLGLEQDNFTQSSLIKGIKGSNHQYWFQKSIDLFEKIKAEGFKADEILQNCLLDACVATKNFKVAVNQLEEMKADERVRPDAITYNTLIKGCALMRNMAFGDKLLREMKAASLEPNDISYNTMIDLAVRVDDLEKAWGYLDEMKHSNIQPDSFTYSTLIKGIKNTKRDKNPNSLAKAFSLLDDLQNEGLQPDEVLFNCLIDACVKFRDIKKAEEAQHTMLKSKIVPSSVTFGILIKGQGNTGFLDKAFEIFNTFLKKKNIRPNDVTQGCLLDACVKSGDTKRAMEVQDMMLADGIRMNTILQTTLIKSHSKDKNLAKALDIFELMSNEERTMPNNVTFNSLIDCAVRCDNAKVARDLFVQMRERNIKPDLITFSTLAKGLCRWEQLNDAIDLLRQMKELNIKPDEVLLNTLLEGCTKKGKIDLALRLFEEMKTARIKPSNVTFSILIKLQGKHRKMDKAMEVLELMKDIGVKPGTVVFTCLIKQAVSTKNVKIAMDIYHRMHQDYVRGDKTTFATLLYGLIEVDNLGDACSVLIDSLNQNIILEQERYEEVLTKVVEEEREISQGATILKLTKKHGLVISHSLEQSLTRIMVDTALNDKSPDHEAPRAFGTHITNTYSNDSKNHQTPNDYYNGKTKNRFVYNSDNKSPIQKAFDGVSNRPQRFKNNKKIAENIKPQDKENVYSQDSQYKYQYHEKSQKQQYQNNYSEYHY